MAQSRRSKPKRRIDASEEAPFSAEEMRIPTEISNDRYTYRQNAIQCRRPVRQQPRARHVAERCALRAMPAGLEAHQPITWPIS
jgi:hypothetical protein